MNNESDVNNETSKSDLSEGGGGVTMLNDNFEDDGGEGDMEYAPVERMARGPGKRGARKKGFLKEDCK